MGQMQWVVGLVVEKKGTEKQTWLGSTCIKKRGLIETMRKKKRRNEMHSMDVTNMSWHF